MNRYVVLARFDKNTEEKLIALRREMTNAGYVFRVAAAYHACGV